MITVKRLTLEDAKVMLDAAERRAREIGVTETICVCDTGLDTGDPATVHPDFRGRIAAIRSFPITRDFAPFINNPGANDGASPNDAATISSAGYLASPAGTFRYTGGAGQDALTVQGGALTFNSDLGAGASNLSLNVNSDNAGTAAGKGHR